ncbi:fumarate hydratase [Shigella flexneri]
MVRHSAMWNWKKNRLLKRKIGPGAQFGGKYFADDIRAIRLPRHYRPVGMGASCSADRNIKPDLTVRGSG